jgi:large subunit ribosomal protein L31
MKTTIHPKYYQASVTCVGCGAAFTTGSTVQNIRVDICSQCHPFFTGQKRLIDSEGRVEKFERRMSQRSEKPKKQPKPVAIARTTVAQKPAAAPAADTNRPRSLREMLQDAANRG